MVLMLVLWLMHTDATYLVSIARQFLTHLATWNQHLHPHSDAHGLKRVMTSGQAHLSPHPPREPTPKLRVNMIRSAETSELLWAPENKQTSASICKMYLRQASFFSCPSLSGGMFTKLGRGKRFVLNCRCHHGLFQTKAIYVSCIVLQYLAFFLIYPCTRDTGKEIMCAKVNHQTPAVFGYWITMTPSFQNNSPCLNCPRQNKKTLLNLYQSRTPDNRWCSFVTVYPLHTKVNCGLYQAYGRSIGVPWVNFRSTPLSYVSAGRNSLRHCGHEPKFYTSWMLTISKLEKTNLVPGSQGLGERVLLASLSIFQGVDHRSVFVNTGQSSQQKSKQRK